MVRSERNIMSELFQKISVTVIVCNKIVPQSPTRKNGWTKLPLMLACVCLNTYCSNTSPNTHTVKQACRIILLLWYFILLYVIGRSKRSCISECKFEWLLLVSSFRGHFSNDQSLNYISRHTSLMFRWTFSCFLVSRSHPWLVLFSVDKVESFISVRVCLCLCVSDLACVSLVVVMEMEPSSQG